MWINAPKRDGKEREIVKTQVLKLKDIHPAAYNPRKILKPGDPEWDALKGSLEDFGLVEPLVVNIKDGKNVLVGGHQRYNVLKTTGVEETEVVVVELGDKEEKQLNIALNRIEGMWDYEKLEVLFEELSTEEILRTGFSQGEIDDILKDLDDAGAGDFDDEDDDTPADTEPKREKKEREKPFQIFLSFPTQEAAEKWLADRDLDFEFPSTSRNLNIRMEGTEYGAD